MKKETSPGHDLENTTSTQSQVGEVLDRKFVEEDAVFGEIREGDTDYRDVSAHLCDPGFSSQLTCF